MRHVAEQRYICKRYCGEFRIQCSMSHVRGRASSDKQMVFNVFNRKLKATDKNCCSVKRFPTDCKCLHHNSKMKRLKSRKERSQMRGGGKEASKSKSHQQSSVDMAHFQNCCHSSCHCTSRRDAPFPNVVPAGQEPSIITGSRLIGHHGLFNHEVKSMDIERLLSEQRKLEKSGQKVQGKNNATSRPSSTLQVPSPFCCNDLLVADTDEVMPFEKEAYHATKAHDDHQEKNRKLSQELIVSPGERQQQQLDPSSGSFKSILSSKPSSLDIVILKSKKTNPVMSEKDRESQSTPTADRGNVKTLKKKVKGHFISTLEHTPKNQESSVNQKEAHCLSPSPIQLSSSHPADGFDVQHRRQDTDCVPKSVSALAAGLCDCLQFPLGRRRNLVAESREVLLRAIEERHGPWLQENLLEVLEGLGVSTSPEKDLNDQEPIGKEEAELLPKDVFTTAFQVNTDSQPCFDNQITPSFKMKGSGHFNWNSSPQRHQNPKQFSMGFSSSDVIASDHSFAPSPTSCWAERASASHHWEEPKSKEAVEFDVFEDSFMNYTRAATERSSGFQYSNGNNQNFLPYQTQLPDRHSAQPMHYQQEQHPSERERYSFVPSFSAHNPNLQLSNHFHPFSQYGHPSTCPPLRSHHTDMTYYPPSHMLEREPAASCSSFPSPEHWSFPPMRLY